MQKVELKAAKVVHVGTCDNSAGNYALAKKKMSMEVNSQMAPLMHLFVSEYQLLRFYDNIVRTRALCKLQFLRLERKAAGARHEASTPWPVRG